MQTLRQTRASAGLGLSRRPSSVAPRGLVKRQIAAPIDLPVGNAPVRKDERGFVIKEVRCWAVAPRPNGRAPRVAALCVVHRGVVWVRQQSLPLFLRSLAAAQRLAQYSGWSTHPSGSTRKTAQSTTPAAGSGHRAEG